MTHLPSRIDPKTNKQTNNQATHLLAPQKSIPAIRPPQPNPTRAELKEAPTQAKPCKPNLLPLPSISAGTEDLPASSPPSTAPTASKDGLQGWPPPPPLHGLYVVDEDANGRGRGDSSSPPNRSVIRPPPSSATHPSSLRCAVPPSSRPSSSLPPSLCCACAVPPPPHIPSHTSVCVSSENLEPKVYSVQFSSLKPPTPTQRLVHTHHSSRFWCLKKVQLMRSDASVPRVFVSKGQS